jgi:hypothetical protein
MSHLLRICECPSKDSQDILSTLVYPDSVRLRVFSPEKVRLLPDNVVVLGILEDDLEVPRVTANRKGRGVISLCSSLVSK